MEKYFIRGTENEIKIGDTIELDFTKKLENGNKKHICLECVFIPELIPILIENKVIDVRKEKLKEPKNEKPLNFFYHDEIEALLEANAYLTERVEELEKKVSALGLHRKKCS